MESPLKRKIVRAGRRFGKTTLAAMVAVKTFLNGGRVLYAVPTGDQITRFWFDVVQALSELIEGGVVKKYESTKIIEYPGTEQRIRAKTAWNADTLRGDYASQLILDEYQMMNEDAWETVGAPMLLDTNGDAMFIYTPPRMHSRAISKATDKLHAAKMFKKYADNPRWLCVHGTSFDNPTLPKEGLEEITLDMTSLAYQMEIMAEDLDYVPGALWNLEMIEADRVTDIPPEALPLARVIVGVDPTGSSTNEAGIVAAAVGKNGHGYVLKDASMLAPRSADWGRAAVWTYLELKADHIAVETNYGGDMARGVIDAIDPNIPVREVVASRGKAVRADPISALYSKHIIHHVGTFKALEEEMCTYVPILSKLSPNRMDALVWALTELFPENQRLALVEHAKSEMEKVKTSTLQKPVTNARTEHCPKCDATTVVTRGGLKHCNSCGEEWQHRVTIAHDRVSRSDFLK